MIRVADAMQARLAPIGSRQGGVALFVALCAPVLFLIVGFGIDYSYASYLNQQLTRATDLAVLASVSQTAATAVGGYSNTSGLQTYGTSVFNENIKNSAGSSATFNLTVSQKVANGMVTAAASYTYKVPAFFSKLIGMDTIPIGSTIVANAQPPTYINYYILVDVSNSMGIGATQSDMATLYNALVAKGNFSQNGEPGCVFACHDPNAGSNYTYTTESVARANNVVLRIDSAKAAIQSIISSAATIAGTTKNIQFGLYLLQSNSNTNTEMVTLAAMSNNYANLISQAGTIDLGSSNSPQVGETDFQNGLAAFMTLPLPPNGSGASTTSPLNFVFLITDGVVDHLNNNTCVSSSCISPINPSWCDAIKLNATLGVIYTTYLEIWQNNDPTTKTYEKLYNLLVSPYKNQTTDVIKPNLQACATSSSYFFEASDGPSITTTMQALFAKTQPISARLIQ